ncbi:MAG: biotin--[acetyl-CoA-carboxylase] ligase [Spirochaetia bacterium]|jgi:BirA family biotin operon repressor/biotin-[acetyl-CoA-carboxylase] ligase
METSLRVPNPWSGASVFIRERTVSTMDDARELALSGCPEGTVVVAGFQQKGRGRAPGRSWHSPPWESLMATVVLDADAFGFPLAQLPLRAAVAACLAVEDTGVLPGIKWPNDLVANEKKLAGILCEMCGPSALVGLGVNCMQKAFPPDLADSACSIYQVTGREASPLSLLPRILVRLKDTLDDILWREKLLARLAFRGQRVRVTLPENSPLEGILQEVDQQGRLVLQDDAGFLQVLSTGELRRAS